MSWGPFFVCCEVLIELVSVDPIPTLAKATSLIWIYLLLRMAAINLAANMKCHINLCAW